MKVLYIGNIVVEFGCVANINKALQKTKHDIFSLYYPTYQNNYDYFNSMMEAQIEGFKPDIVITEKVMGLTYEMIMDLKKKFKVPICQWTFDHMGTVLGEDRYAWWGKQAKAFDLTFNSEDCMHEKYLKDGIKHRIIRQGFNPEVFKTGIEINEEDKKKYTSDVMFVGGAHNKWREEFIENLTGDETIKFRWYTQTYLEELNKAGNCSKIGIATNYDDTEDRGWSNKVAEYMGMGLLVLSPHLLSMDKEGFVDKENIVYYKAHDLDDLKSKIKYYLEHDDEREMIAQCGMELALDTMTWDTIVDGFLEELEKEGVINERKII